MGLFKTIGKIIGTPLKLARDVLDGIVEKMDEDNDEE